MRIIIIIITFIVSLQSLTKADDIRDFEIEGMSLGDSALNFFTKSEIDKSVEEMPQYPNDEYKIAYISFIIMVYIFTFDNILSIL